MIIQMWQQRVMHNFIAINIFKDFTTVYTILMTSVRFVNKKCTSSIQSKSEILLDGLTKFFWCNDERINQMLPIINGQSKISLRVLDWFVTNYCRKYKTKYIVIDENGDPEKFIVHIEYKGQLKAFNKKLFDPFCRRSRIKFRYDKDNVIITTIGQLNFFKWAIKNNIIKYVEEHVKEIDKDMTQSKKEKMLKKKLIIEKELKKDKQTYKKVINIPSKIKNKLIDIDDSTEEDVKYVKNNKLVISAVKTVKKNQEKIILVFE